MATETFEKHYNNIISKHWPGSILALINLQMQ